MIKVEIEKRLARMEAICERLRNDTDDVIRHAYDIAVEQQDEERASQLARKIRNRLLEESDKQCILDKVLLATPKGNSFSDWLDWLKSLASVTNNEWGTYRQQLRDLPEKEGFPFNVEFPTAPNTEKKED